jgi:TonB family protein
MAIASAQDAAFLGTAVGDLQQLGDGFLKLAEAALEPPPPPPVAPAPPPVSIPVERQAPKVYSSMDADVLGPVDINRQLPAWVPPRAQARTPFRGTLTIVINERGSVENATMARSVTAEYDRELIAATRFWRFRPAERNGLPVKYEKTIDIVLQPRP